MYAHMFKKSLKLCSKKLSGASIGSMFDRSERLIQHKDSSQKNDSFKNQTN